MTVLDVRADGPDRPDRARHRRRTAVGSDRVVRRTAPRLSRLGRHHRAARAGDCRSPRGGEHYRRQHDERALDVGVVSTVNPLSQLLLYAGSGHDNFAGADPFTAYQSAIWDTVNQPEVISSSFSSYQHVSPGSPFYFAQSELFVDAVLRGITVVNAAGDGGSGSEYPNGLTNLEVTHASPYTWWPEARRSARSTPPEPTRRCRRSSTRRWTATGHDLAAGQRRAEGAAVEGGLRRDPDRDGVERLLRLPRRRAGGGDHRRQGRLGRRLSQQRIRCRRRRHQPANAELPDRLRPQPRNLRPAGRERAGRPRRVGDLGRQHGLPVPWPDFEVQHGSETTNTGGTSGAAPLWAALMSQINTIFADQKLPRLGYMNDLLYTAAVIAPAAFNDIQIGNNTSSFVLGGPYFTAPKAGSGPDDPDHADRLRLCGRAGLRPCHRPWHAERRAAGARHDRIAHAPVLLRRSPESAPRRTRTGGWESPAKQKLLSR